MDYCQKNFHLVISRFLLESLEICGLVFGITQNHVLMSSTHFVLFLPCNVVAAGIVDGVVLPTETRLPSVNRPHWLEPTIYSSEEDGVSRASTDGVGGDTLNMLSVAVKILSDKSESNTKVCIFFIFLLLWHWKYMLLI